MELKNIKFQEKPYGGWSARVPFPNGLEVSIVAGQFAYSSPRENLSNPQEYEMYEVAVFKDGDFTREFFVDAYDDVLGYQNVTEVENLLSKIESYVPEV